VNQRLLAELQAESLTIKDELTDMKRGCADAELRATEATRLWEMEVSSRSKLGAKVIEMEKAAGTWEQKVQKEKSRAAIAVQRKQQLEKRLEGLQERNAVLEGQAAAAAERLVAAERELDNYKSGALRSPELSAKIASEASHLAEKLAQVRTELVGAEHRARSAETARADTAIAIANGDLISKEAFSKYKREVQINAKEQMAKLMKDTNAHIARSALDHELQVDSLVREASAAKSDSAEARSGKIARDAADRSRRRAFADVNAKTRVQLHGMSSRAFAGLSESRDRIEAQAGRREALNRSGMSFATGAMAAAEKRRRETQDMLARLKR